jgi:hypothetical protein
VIAFLYNLSLTLRGNPELNEEQNEILANPHIPILIMEEKLTLTIRQGHYFLRSCTNLHTINVSLALIEQ